MLGAPSSCVLVAEETGPGALSGYVTGIVASNEPFSIPRYGYIGGLFVDRERGGRGMESALADAVTDWFKKNRLAVVQIDVLSGRRSEQEFWRSRGFAEFLDHLRRDAGEPVEGATGSPCTVRPARSEDSDAIVLLWKEMMDVHAAIDGRLRVGPDWSTVVNRWVRRWLRDGDSHLLVAETATEVVGFALGGLAAIGPDADASVYGHVAHLCVDPGWRRRGFGRQLVESLREWFLAQGAPSIHTYVSCCNPVSQRFWRGLGYEDFVRRLWCDIV